MQVNGMDVVARVAHSDAVAAALAQTVGCSHLTARKGLVVDGPEVEAARCGVLLAEGHFDGFVGLRRGGRVAGGETRVAPAERRGRGPNRLAAVSGVFDDDAHAVFAIVVGE